MFKVFLCLLLLTVSFPVTGCFSLENANIKQDKEVELNTWDFGKVKQREIVKHTFILKNESAKTLNIKEMHTSCGCTASAVQKKELLPGQETQIEVKFNTGKYLGTVKQFIYVNTDSLDNPVIRYIITADVLKKSP
jgi:hypothetical protein